MTRICRLTGTTRDKTVADSRRIYISSFF